MTNSRGGVEIGRLRVFDFFLQTVTRSCQSERIFWTLNWSLLAFHELKT